MQILIGSIIATGSKLLELRPTPTLPTRNIKPLELICTEPREQAKSHISDETAVIETDTDVHVLHLYLTC